MIQVYLVCSLSLNSYKINRNVYVQKQINEFQNNCKDLPGYSCFFALRG